MASTTIEWCDDVWNVTRGCRRISPGCENCYAERQAVRFSGPGGAYEGLVKSTANGPRWTGKGRFVVEKLVEPLSWKKPKRVFVDSMSDLFFDDFTDEQIAAVFGVMALCPHITFQILTKRPARMRSWFAWVASQRAVTGTLMRPQAVCYMAAYAMLAPHGWANVAIDELQHRRMTATPDENAAWPLPNVWLGTSCEDQPRANERIPDLMHCPAAVRFLSCEPLLGPINLTLYGCDIKGWDEDWKYDTLAGDEWASPRSEPDPGSSPALDWVIVGCESGPRARSCQVEWLRALRDQCARAKVPYFLKQARHTPNDWVPGMSATLVIGASEGSLTKGGVVSLPYLDGKQHADFPAALHHVPGDA